MISLLAFLFVLGVLIIAHELGHFMAAKKMGIRIEKFSLGFGYKIISRKKDDTEYTINLIPLGGYVKFAGDTLEEYKGQQDEFLSKAPRQRAFVIFMGPALNYALGFLCFWIIFFSGYPSLTTKVGSLVDGYGAKAAGIRAGDTVVAVDGEKVQFFEDMQKLIQNKKAAETVKLSVKRNGQESSFDVRIKEKALPDLLGKKRAVGLIGITPADEVIKVKHGPIKAFGLAVLKTWDLTVLMYKAFWRMITGNLSVRDSVSGPLGIFYITAQAAQLGPTALLHLIAVLSVSLAIFNLLPMPILDGGHIMFLVIERIRGKQLSLKAEQIVTQTGLTILLSLVVLVTYNDIMRFYGDKIVNLFKP
jgi:regulator of sigma E protease